MATEIERGRPGAARRALAIVLALALAGVAFAGALSVRELAAVDPVGTCPEIGRPGTVLGQPACVYGLAMFIVLAVIAGAGLWLGRRGPARG